MVDVHRVARSVIERGDIHDFLATPNKVIVGFAWVKSKEATTVFASGQEESAGSARLMF